MGNLRAGTARSVVTPPLGVAHGTWRLRTGRALGVRDELFADALVLEGAADPVALVSIDLLAVDSAFSDTVRAEASRITGIAADAIVINASHNHCAPVWPLEPAPEGTPLGRWREAMVDRVVGCIDAAARRTRHARIGVGSFRAPGISANRVWPDRPVDDSGLILRIDASDGSPLMTVTQFACHGLTVGGHTLDWTADFPGAARKVLEARLPGSRSMFLQGAAGDIAPYDFWFGNADPQPMGFVTMERMGSALAHAALAAREQIRTSSQTEIRWAAAPLELKPRKLPWSMAEIEEARSEIPRRKPAELPEVWPAHVHMCNSAQDNPEYYQGLALNTFASILRRGENPLTTVLRALQVGSLSILATPFELFSDLASAIRDLQPHGSPVAVLGYCDDYLGYFPPDGAADALAGLSLREQLDQKLSRWAYGITNTHIEDGQGEVFTRAAASLLRKLQN
jgi:hypothetical protein